MTPQDKKREAIEELKATMNQDEHIAYASRRNLARIMQASAEALRGNTPEDEQTQRHEMAEWHRAIRAARAMPEKDVEYIFELLSKSRDPFLYPSALDYLNVPCAVYDHLVAFHTADGLRDCFWADPNGLTGGRWKDSDVGIMGHTLALFIHNALEWYADQLPGVAINAAGVPSESAKPVDGEPIVSSLERYSA